MSLHGHVISSIYSSRKYKTKLKVISRYLEVIPVSFREIAETSRKVMNLRAQSCPDTGALFHGYFSRQMLIPQLRVSSDLKGRTGESVHALGKPK